MNCYIPVRVVIVQWIRYFIVVFFKQKTAYEIRIIDWSSDVCSSDLAVQALADRLQMRLRVGRHLQLALVRDLDPALDRQEDRKSVVEGKSVSVRVDIGGRRII